jgi:hypothetical protein
MTSRAARSRTPKRASMVPGIHCMLQQHLTPNIRYYHLLTSLTLHLLLTELRRQHGYYGQYSQSNPYGYSSTGHLGTYSGPAPQYNPSSQTPIYSPTGQVPPPAYAATTSQYNLTSQSTEYHPPSQSSASVAFPGSTPQYNTPGQTPVPPGQSHPPNGNTYPPQDGYTPSFGPDSQVSSPFSQSSPLLVHTGESSTNISITNQYTSPTSSTPHVNQPEWQMGSQPAIPQSTKPTHGHPHQSATSSPAQSRMGQYASQQAGYPQQYAQGQPYPPSQYSGVPSSNHAGPAGGDQHFQQPPPSQSIPQYGQPPQADIPVHGTTPGFHGSPLFADAPNQPVPYGSHPHYSVNPQYPQPYQVPTQGSSFPATHPPAPPANAPVYASNPTIRQGPPDSAQPYPAYGGQYPIGNQPTNNRQEGSNSGQHNPHAFAVELADTSVSPSSSRPPAQLSNSSKAETSSNSYAGNFNTQQSFAHPPELGGDKNEALYNSGASHAPTTAAGGPPSQNPAMPDSQFLSGNWASTMPSGTGQHLQPNSQPPYGFNYASGYGS